jgi:hypothetical protein
MSIRVITNLVNHSAGNVKENLQLQRVITLKLTDTGIKNFIFITYLSDSISFQNFVEIQDDHVNCVHMTLNNPTGKSVTSQN